MYNYSTPFTSVVVGVCNLPDVAKIIVSSGRCIKAVQNSLKFFCVACLLIKGLIWQDILHRCY